MKQGLKNTLLKRQELALTMESVSAPSQAIAVQFVAEQLKVSSDCVTVASILNRYGSHTFVIKARVYDTPEMKARIEPKQKEKKAKA